MQKGTTKSNLTNTNLQKFWEKAKKYFIDPDTGCYSPIIKFLRETTEMIHHPKDHKHCQGYSKILGTYMSQNIRQEKV